MAEIVNGRNVMVYKYDVGTDEDIPFACGTAANLSIQTESKEITSQTSAFFREYKPDLSSWTIQISGFTILNTQYNYLLMLQMIKDREVFLTKFVIDNGGVEGLSIFSGQAFITSCEISGTDDALSTYTVTLQGSGEYSLAGATVTPGGVIIIAGTAVQVFQTVAIEGQSSFTFSGAVGLTMLYGSRGSMTIQPLSYSLLPTDSNGGLWTIGTGTLDLTTPCVAGESIIILAQ